MIQIDDSGMPIAPGIRQLVDKDIRTLYQRDRTRNKERYIAECIVIYYLGDPKSPAKQSGLSDAEALNMAIEQAGLPKSYIPDALVVNLIKRYYKQCITEAGLVVENILKSVHNINLGLTKVNDLLNEKLNTTLSLDDVQTVVNLVDNVTKKASELPSILKKLNEAKENLMYEKQTEVSRGGNVILSSMNAEEYE